MNSDWITFLKSYPSTIIDNSEMENAVSQEIRQDSITALTQFSIIKVAGSEANTFLQGQLTCNINDLTDTNSFFAAFCNAKGRAISTLLIIKDAADYLLILPAELVEKVSKKLQMYIMRSDVQLNDLSHDLCLIGITADSSDILPVESKTPFTVHRNNAIYIKFPAYNNRYLVISQVSQAISIWKSLTKNTGLNICHSNTWVEQDINAGIPWLSSTSSEEYIPQMLNIDKLGGISFNKGCYTGQEIIARTHYLGKSKRELYLANCDTATGITIDNQIITDNSEQVIGKILSLYTNTKQTKMLIVLQSADSELKNLTLNNSNQDKIHIIDFQ